MSAKKVLWSVEPFSSDKEVLKKTARYLHSLVGHRGYSIEPVYILSPKALRWQSQISEEWLAQLLPVAETALNELRKDLHFAELAPPKIIVSECLTRRHDVEELMRYAKNENAAFVALTTHTRGAAERFFVGSFAESVLLRADRPVLAVPPTVGEHARPKHILFPTDLSNESAKALMNFAEFARDIGARLSLFYKVPDPVEPILQTGVYLAGGGWVSLTDYLAKHRGEAEGRLRELAEEARCRDVEVETVIDDNVGGVEQAIMNFARSKGVDLIGLESQTGGFQAFFVGSVSRKLVRDSEIPIWIYHEASPQKG